MPLPLVPLIAAGASLVGTGINAMATGSMNKKTRRWNEKMYGIQRADSLADWNMQNEYNSPVSQMQRLRDAELNPNLVYGTGAVANSSNMPRNADVKQWSPKAPDFSGVGESIFNYYDVQTREAQIDNLKAMNTNLVNEALLKSLQASKLGVDTARSQFDLDLATESRNWSLEAIKQNVRKLTASTDVMLDRNEREAIQLSSNIAEALQRIAKMRSETANSDAERSNILKKGQLLSQDIRIKELDAKLADKGIQPGKPAYDTVLKSLIDYLTDGTPIKDFMDNIDKKIADWEDEVKRQSHIITGGLNPVNWFRKK